MRGIHDVRRGGGLVAAVALTIALAGCDPSSPAPTASPTAAPTPTATSTSSATPSAEPFVADCQSIIPPSRRNFVSTSGWPLFATEDFFAKVRSEVAASPFILMQDNGGIVCPYHTDLEIVLAYGYAPLADSQVAEANSLILGYGGGHAPSPYAGGSLYDSGNEGDAFEFFLVVPGALYVASTVELIDEMIATIP